MCFLIAGAAAAPPASRPTNAKKPQEFLLWVQRRRGNFRGPRDVDGRFAMSAE
jgi:hypothetical protein